MFRYLWDRMEHWLASQVRAVVRDTMSPAVMQRAMDALRNEYKAEMKAYRREKEEEMGVFVRKHDHLIESFGKITNTVNELKFKNKALEKALSVCAPPTPGKTMTEIEIRQLLTGIEDDMLKDPELTKTVGGVDVNDELLKILEWPKAVDESWKVTGVREGGNGK